MQAHPMVTFRDGPAGRRPVLMGGPEIADVIPAVVGGDVPADDRLSRAADLLNLPLTLVEAAWAYYAAYEAEIDAALAKRAQLAEQSERVATAAGTAELKKLLSGLGKLLDLVAMTSATRWSSTAVNHGQVRALRAGMTSFANRRKNRS